MKKLILIFIYCAFISLNAKSANIPAWAWGQSFTGNVTAMEYADNYIYTAGRFAGGSFIFGNANIINYGASDVVIAKWDTLGNMIWATSIWGAGNDSVISIKVNANNELVIAGSSNSQSLNIGPNVLNTNGGYDIYYAKYDLNGNALNAYIYGGAGNEYAIDMCTDYLSNVYIASVNKLTQYSSAGVQGWQKNITATQGNYIHHLSYSSFDSTIHLCGLFAGTFTLDNHTVSRPFNVGWNYWPSAVYVAKIPVNGSTLWLHEYNAGHSGYSPEMYVNNTDGKIYVAHAQSGVADNYFRFFELFSNGSYETQVWGGLPHPTGWDPFLGVTPYSMSGSGDYVSIATNDVGEGFLIYKISTHSLVKIYDLSHAPYTNDPHIFRGLNAIYTPGKSPNNDHKFGKLSPQSLTGTPTYQNVYSCLGSLDTLYGNIAGGVGSLTYSWLPVTGLNNTNTNTVTFTATADISYTLTVTDSLGTVAKDTFNVIVETPTPTPNITSLFPVVCDSSVLNSNNGVAGNWYHYIPFNLPYYQWQLIGVDTAITIYTPGTYKYEKANACNIVTDTIQLSGTLTVTANATADTICSGQSITLTGTGALNYVWTGGVQNNTPFTALNTQTYVVTGTDASGCSNTSYITILVNPTYTSTATISICANQTPYSWNGQSLDSTGTYTANYTTINGCDSAEVLNLTVSPCIVCVPNITINYTPFYNSLTESQSWIITSGTVLVLAGTNVKLDAHANSHVTINPGFKAEHGSVFVAQAYNGCNAGAPQLPQLGKIMNTDLFTSNEIVLYPNPTTGIIHIKHDEKLAGIQIFDMVGKLIINQKCEGEMETNIDLSNLPNGVYHVKAAGYNSIKLVKNY